MFENIIKQELKILYLLKETNDIRITDLENLNYEYMLLYSKIKDSNLEPLKTFLKYSIQYLDKSIVDYYNYNILTITLKDCLIVNFIFDDVSLNIKNKILKYTDEKNYKATKECVQSQVFEEIKKSSEFIKYIDNEKLETEEKTFKTYIYSKYYNK